MRKTILCYGDSNTWGYNPATADRFPEEVRWTGVLRRELGGGFDVIAEGQNGRTTVWDDPIEEGRNGRAYLGPCLESHRPIDAVVLMLGTNDLKRRFSVPACDIAGGIAVLLEVIGRSAAGPAGAPPKVLLIVPPPLARLTELAEMFEGGAEKSRRLAAHYREQARLRGCALLDAGEVIVSSDIDGIHFEAGEHRKLGEAVARRVRELV